MRRITKKTVIRFAAWALAIAWMGVIFFFSSQPGAESDVTSGGIVDIIIRALKIDVTAMSAQDAESTFMTINGIVRTAAHFTEYGILGVLVTILSFTYMKKGRTVFATALGASFAYAWSDEFHQSFVPLRSCSVEDVAVDLLGALLGIILVYVVAYAINKRRTKRK